MTCPPDPVPNLRPFQSEALAFLEESDAVLCIAPTGSGKSRIFQEWIRTRSRRIRVLVVVPLLALGEQQRQALERLGISTVGKSETISECILRWNVAEAPTVWVTSPERLLSPNVESSLRVHPPDLLVLDEVHTFWEWGSGFRPSMRSALELLAKLRIPKTLALTATLPEAAQRWLLNETRAWQWRICGESALPATLAIAAEKVLFRDRPVWMKHALSRGDGGLLYVSTRQAVDRWSAWLRPQLAAENSVIAYRGGWSSEERTNQLREIERNYRSGRKPWIVATSAFGLGMDFPGLKRVIAVHPPMTPLAVAQVLGRAGRNGATGSGTVLWSEEDFRLQSWAFTGARETMANEALRVLRWLQAGGAREELEKLLRSGKQLE